MTGLSGQPIGPGKSVGIATTRRAIAQKTAGVIFCCIIINMASTQLSLPTSLFYSAVSHPMLFIKHVQGNNYAILLEACRC